MLREGTAVPAVWFSIELIFGLFALKHGAESGWDSSAFTKPGGSDLKPDHHGGRAAAHQNWFELAPKAANIIVKDEKWGQSQSSKGFGWSLR